MRILLLSEKNEFAKKVVKILSDEGYQVSLKTAISERSAILTILKYDLVIMDQNFLLPDRTPLILMISKKIKTVDHPALMLMVPENFVNHELYPLVDNYISEKTEKNKLLEYVNYGVEARQFLKVSGHEREQTLEAMQDFFNEELTARDRKLSSITMQMVKKNSQLYHISSSLDKLKENNFRSGIEQLKNTIRQYLNEDERIESFFFYFNKTQPGFIKKLDAAAALTLTEKKHCACLKMGLDNKQIAALFSISHQSVKKSHTRLKKKLVITRSQSLREFIDTI